MRRVKRAVLVLNISQRVGLVECVGFSVDSRAVRVGAVGFAVLAVTVEVFLVVFEDEAGAVPGALLVRVTEAAVLFEGVGAEFGVSWTTSCGAIGAQGFGYVSAWNGSSDVCGGPVAVVVVAIRRACEVVGKHSVD